MTNPILSRPPALALNTYPLFEQVPYFEPVTVSVPSRTAPLAVPAETVAKQQDDIWYINIASDGVFEYRSVEVPFELAALCPNRNLTEVEWRSIGITQSRGWENHWRQNSERNIFLFRRPIAEDPTAISTLVKDQIASGISITERSCGSVDLLNFPMAVFDRAGVDCSEVTGGRPEIEVTSADQMIQLQLRILRFSLTNLPPAGASN